MCNARHDGAHEGPLAVRAERDRDQAEQVEGDDREVNGQARYAKIMPSEVGTAARPIHPASVDRHVALRGFAGFEASRLDGGSRLVEGSPDRGSRGQESVR